MKTCDRAARFWASCFWDEKKREAFSACGCGAAGRALRGQVLHPSTMSEDRQPLLPEAEGGDNLNPCCCGPTNGCRRQVLRLVTWSGFDIFILLIIIAVRIAVPTPRAGT